MLAKMSLYKLGVQMKKSLLRVEAENKNRKIVEECKMEKEILNRADNRWGAKAVACRYQE